MNQRLPKPIQEALARSRHAGAADVHPSADALTAFVEHSLPQRESQSVTEHLVSCADCREVVFLASGATQEQVGAAQGLVSAAPHRGWRRWWVWAPAIAAVLVIAGVVSQPRFKPGQRRPVAMAVNRPPAPPPEQSSQYAVSLSPEKAGDQAALEIDKTPALPKAAPKAARARTNQQQSGADLTEAVIASNVPKERPSAHPPAIAESASPPSSEALGIVQVPGVAAPTHNAFVGGEGQTASTFAPGPRPEVAMRAVAAPHSRWRVTTDGHLERSTASGSWTPVLADQPVTFRVVSVVGSNVWAGGGSGALFHSSDGGQNWSKQPLAGETGAIVSIRFTDASNGTVSTDGGLNWTTSDGGVTWTKE